MPTAEISKEKYKYPKPSITTKAKYTTFSKLTEFKTKKDILYGNDYQKKDMQEISWKDISKKKSIEVRAPDNDIVLQILNNGIMDGNGRLLIFAENRIFTD